MIYRNTKLANNFIMNYMFPYIPGLEDEKNGHIGMNRYVYEEKF